MRPIKLILYILLIIYSNYSLCNTTNSIINQDILAKGIFEVYFKAKILEKFKIEIFKKKNDSIDYTNEGINTNYYIDRLLNYDNTKLNMYKYLFSYHPKLHEYTFFYNYSFFDPITIVINPLNRFYILELNQQGDYNKLYKKEIDRTKEEDLQFFSRLLIFSQVDPEEDLEFILIDSTNFKDFQNNFKEIKLPSHEINDINSRSIYYSLEPEIGRVIEYRLIFEDEEYRFLKIPLRQDTWIIH